MASEVSTADLRVVSGRLMRGHSGARPGFVAFEERITRRWPAAGSNAAAGPAHLVSGHPMLAPAAMEAVKKSKYRPYLVQGRTVEVEGEVRIRYSLDRS